MKPWHSCKNGTAASTACMVPLMGFSLPKAMVQNLITMGIDGTDDAARTSSPPMPEVAGVAPQEKKRTGLQGHTQNRAELPLNQRGLFYW